MTLWNTIYVTKSVQFDPLKLAMLPNAVETLLTTKTDHSSCDEW